MAINATPRIRDAAFRFAKIIREDEQFMEDVTNNIIAIETGKRSSMTLLWDLKHIKDIDTSAFPKVGSVEPKAKADVNILYDWYQTSDKKDGRFYYDLCEALDPDLFALNRAFTEYNRSKTDNKDELAKTIPSTRSENFFRSFQHATEDLAAITKKYNRRWSSFTDMIIKAAATEQIVARLNTETTKCFIREKKDKDGKVIGYDESPSPISFSNQPAMVKDPDNVAFKSVIWSVGTLNILEREVRNEKGEGTGFTQLDVLFNKGEVTFETVTGLLKRQAPEKEKVDRASVLKSLKAEKPEEVETVLNVLAGYFLDFKSDGSISVIERVETKFLDYLKPATHDETVVVATKLAEVFDSIASKLDGRYVRIRPQGDAATPGPEEKAA